MKVLIAIIIALSVSACGLDPGRQGDLFNTRDVFAKHERDLHLQP